MGWGELERRRHGDGPPDPLLGLVVVVRRFPVTGNVYVEIQESHNIVLRQHRLTPNEDVVVDVPNVAGLDRRADRGRRGPRHHGGAGPGRAGQELMHAVTWFLLISIAVTIVAGLVDGRWRCETTTFAIGGLIAACIFGLTFGVAAGQSRVCEVKADDLGRDHRYGLVAGCRVETDDGVFVPLDNFRITDEENGDG